MTTITPAAALDLARRFKAGALALGQFQLNHWATLTPSQRQVLTDKEYALLDQSQNLITAAVGVQLDAAQASLADIQQATATATRALTSVTKVEPALRIATALGALGVAVFTGNPGAMAAAVAGVLAVVKD